MLTIVGRVVEVVTAVKVEEGEDLVLAAVVVAAA